MAAKRSRSPDTSAFAEAAVTGSAREKRVAAGTPDATSAPVAVVAVPDAAERAKAIFVKRQQERAAAVRSAGSASASAGGVKPWKKRQAARSSAATWAADSNAGNKAWRANMAAKATRKFVSDMDKEAKEEESAKRAEVRAKRIAKLKRKAENELKSSSFQVLRNPEKVKKMNKKQLRQVRKTVVNEHGGVELVSPWA